MRGDSVNQRIKLDELRGQRTALRKEVQDILTNIQPSVIDSCIKVIIGLPYI